DDIAIIGVAGRYPQAPDLHRLWLNLRAGRDCVTEVPASRWDHARFFDPSRRAPGKTYARRGGFLDGVDRFDPLFFNISPREAEVMEPQERLFLECAYEAVEDAGYTPRELGRAGVGVFAGVMYEEYQLFAAQMLERGRPVVVSASPAAIPNRVSFFCNFTGPSVAVDTMCSSSLTAIHLACRSLLAGECGAAVAGGVNVSIHPAKYLMLGQGGFASSTGRCMSFGEGGDGYVPGEGVGAVVLKRLRRAEADGDHVYAVIKATGVNHGGRTNGFTVPSVAAQAEVIAGALRRGGVGAETVSYVEAHGTGTALGDPVEIAGLAKAFGGGGRGRRCAVGSIKSNIGHCESAAGVAGVTKVLLQMRHGELAPSLHSGELNRRIDFAATPFYVQRELAEWRRSRDESGGREWPRRAGVSSFGAGGSNAHVILEEYAGGAEQGGGGGGGPVLVLASGRKEEQLREWVRRLRERVERGEYGEGDLERIGYTSQVGREALEARLGVVAGSLEELRRKLSAFLN
ncbi:MAG TPA: beta-ketoacyl synthase N-terminal-like domain-containing protein, partial [Pyrinomonadaceae bacterium]